jgi:hypothetical protein
MIALATCGRQRRSTGTLFETVPTFTRHRKHRDRMARAMATPLSFVYGSCVCG